MRKKTEKSKIANIIFAIIFTILIIYALFVIFLLLFGIMTSLKSIEDVNGGFYFYTKKNILGFPDLNASHVWVDPETGEEYIYHSRREFFQLFNYRQVIELFTYKKTTSFYVNGGLDAISHYQKVWFGGSANGANSATFIDIFINTFLYTVGGAVIMCFMPALTAYITAKYDYPWCKVLHLINIVIMCIPIVGRYPTELTFLRNTRLYDNMLGNFIQKMTGGGTYYLVYYAFFKGVSDVYRDAASIDGASEWTITFRIYFPLAQKMILTVFLIQFVNLWNDYQTLYLYLPSYPTFAYMVFYKVIEATDNTVFQELPMKTAACMFLSVPVLILFIIFKDKLMGSISLGGIKE